MTLIQMMKIMITILTLKKQIINVLKQKAANLVSDQRKLDISPINHYETTSDLI